MTVNSNSQDNNNSKNSLLFLCGRKRRKSSLFCHKERRFPRDTKTHTVKQVYERKSATKNISKARLNCC